VTLTTGNTITPGTPKVFDIYVTDVSGTLGTAGQSALSLQLGAATGFIFTDVNGGLVGIPAKTGADTYIVSYPTNQVSLHN
jgi:hypothetical protein